jgi:hypothetical protein
MNNILRNSNFGFTKWCVALIAAGWMGITNHAQANLIYFEDFSFSGSIIANGWTRIGTTTTNPLNSASPGLSFPGITTTGNSVSLTTSGEDAYRALASPNLSGDFYASFLINVSAAQATGDYFLASYSTAATGGGYFGRVFIKSVAGGYALGISKNTTTAVWDTTARSFNTTYLVVMKMSRVGSNLSTTTDDPTYLFINPLISPAEPSPTVTGAVGTGNPDNYVGIDGLALRQGNASNAPTMKVSAIRLGTSWTDVIPVGSGPSISSFSPSSGTVGASVTISGTNLGSSPTIKFNGTTATVTASSATEITATVPSGAT